MKVTIYNTQKAYKINKRAITNQVLALLKFLSIKTDEIILHFVGSKKISSLHNQFFNDPSVTDCISFPLDSDSDEPYKILGEIFVCPKVAFEYAKKNNEDYQSELTLYVVHGILHLLGFDDIEESERRVMKKNEKKCIEFLKSNNLL